MVIFALVAMTGSVLVHGSQASPRVSPSLSSCDGSDTSGQSSAPSQRPSPSASGWPVSAGHDALVPVQFSATSHTPVEDRQTVPLAANPSVGHVPDEPVQLSATSQRPAA